jgi:anti-sigma-K factor RskA
VNCDEARELSGAYALGALPDGERADFERHVEACQQHEDLASLVATARILARATEEREPPPALRERIIAAARETRPLDVPRATAPRRDEPPRRRWLRPAALAAVFAALGIAVGALLAGVFAGGDEGETVVLVYRGRDALLRVERTPGDASVGVRIEGLERLPEGQSYQLWAVRGEQWHAIGVFNTNPEGAWHGSFPFELAETDRLAVTVEPAGGSERPTSETLLSSPL